MPSDENLSVWELYGLKENPLSTNPLLVKGGIIPLDSFYSRGDELARLRKLFRSQGGTRILVVGQPGVGKTTFVNFGRAEAIKNKFFTPFQEIKVQPEWDADDLILNTISSIYSTLKLIEDDAARKLSEKLKPFVDFYEITGRDYSLTIMGSGVGFGENRSFHQPKLTSSRILELFQETIGDLKRGGYREIIIHYNNLELFEEDEKKLKALLNKIRDFLQTPGVHFIFVGNEYVASVIHGIPRVSAIFQDTPIKLDPLSRDDIFSIVQKRVHALTIPGLKIVAPCTKDTLSLLYDLYEGNIRAIFNSLSTAILETVKDTPVTLDEHRTRGVLSLVAEKRFTANLTPAMQKVLYALLAMKEGTNTALSKKLNIAPQNMSSYLKELSKTSCVFLRRVEGREKFYAVSDWVKWLTFRANGDRNSFQDKLSWY